MIDLKLLKEEGNRFPEPLKSLIELSRESMKEDEFLIEFFKWRQKAREIDAQKQNERS